MGGACLYCHVEALADVADLRLELICVCLVRSLLTPHEQETLFCMDTVLCLFTRAPHPTVSFFKGWVVVDLQQQRGEWEEMRSGKGCRR